MDVKDICDRLLDGPVPPLRSSAEVVDLARRAERRHRAGFAAVAAAAAVVAVIATATAVPLSRTSSGTAPSGGFGAASPAPPPSPTASPSPIGRDLGKVVRPAQVKAVVNEMAAAAAGAQPLTVPAGKLLYLRTSNREAPSGRLHEMWLDPQGMIPLRIDLDGVDTSTGPKSDRESEVDQARQQFATDGPSLRMPTPQWLATLPTNPNRLLQLINQLNAGTKNGGAYYAFKEIGELFFACGAVLTPQVRAGFYHALGKISGVTATELRVDGRKLYALREPDRGRGFTEELLLDPATGQVAGRRTVEASTTATGLARWHYAVVDTAGERR